MQIALQGGPLHRKHRIYFDRVAVAAVPENYEDRLIEMLPGAHRHLRLMALDPYDIALSKLERNSRKDRDDVRFLGQSIPFDLAILQQRYEAELRWQLGRPDREDLTRNCGWKCSQSDWAGSALEKIPASYPQSSDSVRNSITLGKAIDGGRGRTRTDMRLPSADFESAVAANFTTRPL